MKKLNKKVNVAMLHPGRVGSKVLARMLSSHSKIFWSDEIFEPYMVNEKNSFNKNFIKKKVQQTIHPKENIISLFETKYLKQQHLAKNCINMDIEEYLRLLRELNFTKFITIHRKNHLRRIISILVARQSKQWHSTNKTLSPKKITVNLITHREGHDPGEPILDVFRRLDAEQEQLMSALLNDDVLSLTYEDDILDDPIKAYKKVCTFLNIKDESPINSLHRTNPFKLEDMILNFDDVRETLSDTEYSWMLDN